MRAGSGAIPPAAAEFTSTPTFPVDATNVRGVPRSEARADASLSAAALRRGVRISVACAGLFVFASNPAEASRVQPTVQSEDDGPQYLRDMF